MLTGCVGQTIGTNEIPVKLIINYSDHFDVFNATVLENSSVFDLLTSVLGTGLEYSESPGLGAFINGINNVSNSQTDYWMFYVEGNLSNVGVSSYLIDHSVTIEMRYEKPVW